MFPAICFVHYPAIAKIVREEAAKFGINYASYRTLPGIFMQFIKFMKDMGTADQIGDITTVRHRNNELALQVDIAKTSMNSQATTTTLGVIRSQSKETWPDACSICNKKI